MAKKKKKAKTAKNKRKKVTAIMHCDTQDDTKSDTLKVPKKSALR